VFFHSVLRGLLHAAFCGECPNPKSGLNAQAVGVVDDPSRIITGKAIEGRSQQIQEKPIVESFFEPRAARRQERAAQASHRAAAANP
jgi:hypothetical protein